MARTRSAAAVLPINTKRKIDVDDEPPRAPPQPKKKRKTKIPRRAQPKFGDLMANETPEDLAERFTEFIKYYDDGRSQGHSSDVPFDDCLLPAKAFRDTTDFAEERLVKNLPKFLEQHVEGGAETLKTCNEASSPHTLIVASSAMRTQDILREIRQYGSENNKIAKLFAKHMKLADMVPYVQKTKFGIGAGTPSRIRTLIEADVLKIGSLKRIVLDGSHLDEKKRTMWTDREIFMEVFYLVNLEALKLQIVNGTTEVIVF